MSNTWQILTESGRRLWTGPLGIAGVAVWILLMLPFSWAASDLDAAVAGLQRRYQEIMSLRADFVQTYRAPGIVQTESGVMVMKKPGLMRWEYRSPEEKFFIADGRDTYLYTPADRQVLVQRFSPEDLRSTPLQFLLGRGDLRDSFDVSWETDAQPILAGDILLRLAPKSSDADYSSVVIECDSRNYEIRRILIRERNGDTSEFLIQNIEFNIKTGNNEFQFKVPKGVEVVRLDGK